MATARGPRSIRFGPDLARRLELASRRAGISQAELIRDAVERRCRELLGESALAEWGGYVGAFKSEGGPYARDVSREFGKALDQKHGSRRRS